MGGAATLGSAALAPGLGLGNPVHLATGNKYQLDIDLPPNHHAPGLELVRHYNGLATQGGALGRNWALSYDARLIHRGDGWRVQQGDGSLKRIAAPEPFAGGHIWRWPGGGQLHFDAHGRLTGIHDDRGVRVRIHRYPVAHRLSGLIARVEHHNGQVLAFQYSDAHDQIVLAAVDTPLGRFAYRYGVPDARSGHRSPRLEAVLRPDGMQRHYHYEPPFQSGNPYALTGISVAAPGGPPKRLNTWKYDRYGRAIKLQRHGHDTPVLRVEYLRTAANARPGLTRVQASNGRRHDIRFRRIRGEYRLLGRHDVFGTERSHSEYDADGRPVEIDGMSLQRGPSGELTGLVPATPGWPGLSFRLEGQGAGYSWRSNGTGRTRVLAGASRRPALLQYANGDTLTLSYNAQGRPARLEATAAGPAQTAMTSLQWRGRLLVRIEHPHETEHQRHDAQGRIVERIVQRPAGDGTAATIFKDAFHYDAQGRLLRHDLPEGGALHYTWRGKAGDASTPAALHWETADGRRLAVFTSAAGVPGYRYGNGLTLVTSALPGGHADRLALFHGEELWWQQQRSYDPAGRVTHDHHDFPPYGHRDHQHYTYDAQSRLQGARHGAPRSDTSAWYAWHADGGLAAVRQGTQSHVPDIQRDAAGLPTRVGPYALRYGPERRLQTIMLAATGRVLAHYQHNAFGHRIIKRRGPDTTHFLYLNSRLVAEARSREAGSPPRLTRRYLHAGLTPVGMIEYPADGAPRLYAVHADLSGAPRMVTDDERRMRWLAGYSPTGRAARVAGELSFPLRLPGQYEDEETGWHDNLLRTYAPDRGHYLEPDPLGPLPDTDAYGYARQQPWRYADPYGLVLFAFDGTRYSADTMGNVWTLAQAYRDGGAHYHSGPGNSSFLDWDALVAWRAGRILENQWQALLTAVEHHPADRIMPIDIIGFSRGAALARHFGNRIAAHVQHGVFSVTDPLRGAISACVDLRFMGLFDTVAQFGISGSHNHLYDFGVAELWSWVAHAVALHEHRWAFPLMSADAGGAGNIVEAPFVGAHADIGGGLALRSPPTGAGGTGDSPDSMAEGESDLAAVALAWMHWQALAAGVDFDALAASDTGIESPYLRDMRSPLWRTIQRGDRAVATPGGSTRHAYQDDDPRLGRSTRTQVEDFIHRPDGWRAQAGERVGTVDMAGYSRWLEAVLGWSPS